MPCEESCLEKAEYSHFRSHFRGELALFRSLGCPRGATTGEYENSVVPLCGWSDPKQSRIVLEACHTLPRLDGKREIEPLDQADAGGA